MRRSAGRTVTSGKVRGEWSLNLLWWEYTNAATDRQLRSDSYWQRWGEEATARPLPVEGWCLFLPLTEAQSVQSMVISCLCTPHYCPPHSAWPSSLLPSSCFNHRHWNVVCCHLYQIYNTINSICILPCLIWTFPIEVRMLCVCFHGCYSPTTAIFVITGTMSRWEVWPPFWLQYNLLYRSSASYQYNKNCIIDPCTTAKDV